MVGLEDLYLANMVVRKGLLQAEQVRTALEAFDRAPTKGDLYSRLAAQGGPLAHADMRQKALASISRYVFARNEAAFAARLRASGAVPHPAIDQAMEEQKAANRVISGYRVVIEHVMAQLNRFQVLKQVFRSAFERHTGVIRVVAALVDRRIATVPLKRYAVN